MTVMHALSELGQSVWLDYLHRDMTRSGALERMVHDCLRGATSNPIETLAIQDIQEAGDEARGARPQRPTEWPSFHCQETHSVLAER